MIIYGNCPGIALASDEPTVAADQAPLPELPTAAPRNQVPHIHLADLKLPALFWSRSRGRPATGTALAGRCSR